MREEHERELPWDPLWAYVLGEDEETVLDTVADDSDSFRGKKPSRLFPGGQKEKKNSSVDDESGSMLSFFTSDFTSDVESNIDSRAESRDDGEKSKRRPGLKAVAGAAVSIPVLGSMFSGDEEVKKKHYSAQDATEEAKQLSQVVENSSDKRQSYWRQGVESSDDECTSKDVSVGREQKDDLNDSGSLLSFMLGSDAEKQHGMIAESQRNLKSDFLDNESYAVHERESDGLHLLQHGHTERSKRSFFSSGKLSKRREVKKAVATFGREDDCQGRETKSAVAAVGGGGLLSLLMGKDSQSRETSSSSLQEKSKEAKGLKFRNRMAKKNSETQANTVGRKKNWQRKQEKCQMTGEGWGWEIDPVLFRDTAVRNEASERDIQSDDCGRQVRIAVSQNVEPPSELHIGDSKKGWDSNLTMFKKKQQKTRNKKGQKPQKGKSRSVQLDSDVWDSGDNIAAEFEASQNSLLGWVGLNTAEKAKEINSRSIKIGKKDNGIESEGSVTSNNSFSFGAFPTILGNWGDDSYSESDGSSTANASNMDNSIDNSASTQENSDSFDDGNATANTSHIDDSTFTHADSVEDEATQDSITIDDNEECAESTEDSTSILSSESESSSGRDGTRLAFQPVNQEEKSSVLLDESGPFICKDDSERIYRKEGHSEESENDEERSISVDPYHVDEGTESNSRSVHIPCVQHRSVDFAEGTSISDSVLSQGRGATRAMCCSVKDLSREQRNWSAQSGLPFHELSPEERILMFPKLRSVRDEQKYVSSSILGESFGKSCSAHLQIAPDHGTPQSLFEYEYENGINMCAVYNNFGSSKDVTLFRGMSPVGAPSNKNAVSIQIEASSVSKVDSYIRQGEWWGRGEVPLPNIPGLDVVGKLCKVDKDSAKRYGLAKGDRILSLVKWGGNSRYTFVDPSRVVKVPETVDPSAAVCLAYTYLTAFQVLHQGQSNKIRYCETSLKGKTVLMLGYALSPVGRALVQLATNAGAFQIYGPAKAKHSEAVAELGVQVLKKNVAEWSPKLHGEFDYIISFEDESFVSYRKFLSPKGECVMVRSSPQSILTSVEKRKKSKLHRFQKKTRNSMYDVFEEWEKNAELCKLDLEHLVSLLEKNIVAPNLLDRISLSKVSRAQEMVESKRMSGFIVCEPWLVKKSRVIRL